MPQIFSFGSNGSGQLGIGHVEDVSEPKKVVLPTEAEKYAVMKVAAGGNHTIILLSNGHAYASGENEDGRCGFVGDISSSTRMIRVGCKDGENLRAGSIRLCCATWQATILIFEDGNVFSCGTGNKGELGLGDSRTEAKGLQLLENFPPGNTKVEDISSCMSHVVAILSDGTVFGWGNGRKGQLGLPACNKWVPSIIDDIPFKAQKAVCGRDFTLILGDPAEGSYTFLGLDKYDIQNSLPAQLPYWKKVVAGWSSIHMLLKDGYILSFGRNDHNQLVPKQSEQFVDLAAGSEHFLGNTVDGTLLARGWGEHGNCGNHQDKIHRGWAYIPFFAAISYLAAGCATSWITVN